MTWQRTEYGVFSAVIPAIGPKFRQLKFITEDKYRAMREVPDGGEIRARTVTHTEWEWWASA